jgi:hypothetical protein
MAVSVVECWEKAYQWLLDENLFEINQCMHMGHQYAPKKKIHHQSYFKFTALKVKTYAKVMFSETLRTLTTYDKNFKTWRMSLNVMLKHVYNKANGQITSKLWGISKPRCESSKDRQDTLITSKIEYSRLGNSIVSGDFKGDGVRTIVIGAPGYSSKNYSQNGIVFLLEAEKYEPGAHFIENIGIAITGPFENGAGFGHSLAIVDLNKDGIDDLAISAPYEGFGNDTQDGKVYLRFGRFGKGLRTSGWDLIISGVIKHPLNKNPDFNDDRHAVFGEFLFSEDIDLDGYNDLIVGSPYASTIRSNHQVNFMF